jgi:hypothetical protein
VTDALTAREVAAKALYVCSPPELDFPWDRATVIDREPYYEAADAVLAAVNHEAAVEALRMLAAIHHGTLAPSRLHDPRNQEWTDCECKSCRLAQLFGGVS